MAPFARRTARAGRRQWLAGTAALVLLPLTGRTREVLPEATRRALADLSGSAGAREGRVHLNMPRLAENGHSVLMELSVDSPMTASDHVRVVHVLAGRNPIPTVARFHFGPQAPEAFVKTRVRLADSQPVVALAEMSDGSFWTGRAEVIVTLGGCLDPVL